MVKEMLLVTLKHNIKNSKSKFDWIRVAFIRKPLINQPTPWSKTSLFLRTGLCPGKATKIRYQGDRSGYPIGPCESLAVPDKSQHMNGLWLQISWVLFAF